MTAPYRLDLLKARLVELERRLQEILHSREQAARELDIRRREREEAVKASGATRAAALEAGRKRLADRHAGERSRIEGAIAPRLERIERAYKKACARPKERLAARLARLAEEREKARAEALRALPEKYARLSKRLVDLGGQSAAFRAEAERLRARILEFGSGLGVAVESPEPSQDLDPPAPEEVADLARSRLAEIAKTLDSRRRESWLRYLRSGPVFVVGSLALLAHAAALLAVWSLRPGWLTAALGVAPVTFCLCLGLAIGQARALKRRAREVVDSLNDGMSDLVSLLLCHEASLRAGIERHKDLLLEEKINLSADIKEKSEGLEEEARNAAEAEIQSLGWRRSGLVDRVNARRARALERLESRAAEETQALEDGNRDKVARDRAHQESEMQAVAAKGQELLARLSGEWKRAVEEFRRAADEAHRQSLAEHPSWGDPRWNNYRMNEHFPEALRFGEVQVDLGLLAGRPAADAEFPLPAEPVCLPLALSYPAHGNLLLGAAPGTRPRALEALSSTVLRILASFPPGKARFLLFDPVGLGQSFSALMHLADYDEALVGGRIWTESVHIERKLAELTEHVEKVIQKYLRNRYASVDEYNREVGVMAEPYRFVVIADFPTGFTELALERLKSILSSGSRCGVYVLLLHDRGQKLPSAIDPGKFRSEGHVIEVESGRLAVADDVLGRGRLAIEPPPASEALTALLHVIGKQCADAGRVEVPFDAAAPKGEEAWSLDTSKGVRIPLGRAGADRLQYLDLGKGTAQHALIAGKTGSGKSTLFHVMIANAALWYGPRELELYLIDYKKGVEFKTYASNALPHARVVAIESDREFGLSVLRRIDAELARRAELFRAEGVQDFAAFRRSGAKERLPRTLLMIDEFQEFFVEEDVIGQEAALLLDRIVRQGRAFGVHVILGSQTLGGSYTLAKTTLGQMGVRIALQCNEADSYLILSDDNAAARLLSRPGEAIYNDMSGRIEGNNPFQIVWLPDEVEERHLKAVAERAGREGWEPREPMTVFEGNVPAEIRHNVPLRKRLAQPFIPEEEGGAAVWVGEANAIKGPTEVRFRRQGGGNLLITGQHRESALSVMLASAVSLAAAYPPGRIRFKVLDGTPPELAHGRRPSELAEVLPHEVDGVEHSRIAEVMEELEAEVKGRMDGTRKADDRIFLYIYDLQRFRKLRQGDEFSFSAEAGEKPTPDRCFATVLTEGPPQGIHTVVWCDSLTNLNRTLSRKMLKEFEMRVLFQMSASDSSELIDTPAASKLGLYRGLLFQEESGSVEKFRPYALPDAERLEEIRGALQAAARRPREASK
jgi:hypothetical protein